MTLTSSTWMPRVVRSIIGVSSRQRQPRTRYTHHTCLNQSVKQTNRAPRHVLVFKWIRWDNVTVNRPSVTLSRPSVTVNRLRDSLTWRLSDDCVFGQLRSRRWTTCCVIMRYSDALMMSISKSPMNTIVRTISPPVALSQCVTSCLLRTSLVSVWSNRCYLFISHVHIIQVLALLIFRLTSPVPPFSELCICLSFLSN